MKKQKSPSELTAALATAGVSLESLEQRICRQATVLPKFNLKTDGSSGYVYCSDVCIPADGSSWCGYISAADGKTYEQDFSIEGDAVNFTGDPREVIADTKYDYVPAPAGGAAVEASQPRKEGGKFYSADAATTEADAATAGAKTKADHAHAQALHETAARLHNDGGDPAKGEAHRIKAQAHKDCANALESAAAEIVNRKSSIANPLEANFSVEAPEKFDAFMVMPAGVHTVTLGRLGRAHTVTVDVNPAGARARQAHLDAVNAACKLKAYNCFDHQKTAANSHPKKYWWENGSDASRPAGIYECAEPSSAGLEAVTGKVYQGWSETFFVDNEFAGPDRPAQLINPLADPLEADGSAKDPNNYRVMGTLTNRPAFTQNEPLFASVPDANKTLPAPVAPARAGAHSGKTTDNTHMIKTPLDAAALQARIDQLEQEITSLAAKDDTVSKAELRASKCELEARQADLKVSKQTERIAALEAQEVKRAEAAADAAVAAGLEAQAIPMLDKKQQGEWREKFIKDPSLIPLMAAAWGAKRPAGRVAPNPAAVALTGYGDVKPGVNVILRAMNACLKKQRPIQGLDATSCGQRQIVANEMSTIWINEIRGPWELDADGHRRPTVKAEYLMAPLDAALDAADSVDSLNNLGTLAGTFVSQRFLDIFMYKLPLIANGKIMTDFSDQPSDLGQTVNTRKILIPSVQSFDNTLAADGYPNGWDQASAAQTTDVNITLDELIGVPIPFSLATLSSTQRNLLMEIAPAAAYAIAKYFMAKLYKVCTPANFNAYIAQSQPDAQGIVRVPTVYPSYAVALIDFARSKIADVAAAFDANEVPDEDRSVLLNAAYYNKATTDPSLVTFFAGQQSPEIVTQGNLPDLAGFTPIKAPNFPGTNNAFGMFLQKNALLAKSRLPNNLNTIVPGAGNGSVTQIVHPETGLAMLLVQFVDHKRGYTAWLPCAILGAAKGDTRGGIVGTTQ